MVRRFTKKEMQPTRRRLRSSATTAEKLLWRYLNNRRVAGTRFLRQFSVDNYVLDFYAPHLKLAIELDGDVHFASEETIQYDQKRQKYIENYKITFLRFRNEEVFGDLDGVLEKITRTVLTLSNSPLVKDQGRG